MGMDTGERRTYVRIGSSWQQPGMPQLRRFLGDCSSILPRAATAALRLPLEV